MTRRRQPGGSPTRSVDVMKEAGMGSSQNGRFPSKKRQQQNRSMNPRRGINLQHFESDRKQPAEPTPGPSEELCITHKFAICGTASFPFIPTGLRPPAQGWPSATAAGLPWVLGPASKQPQRGCAQIADDWRNTFGVENAS